MTSKQWRTLETWDTLQSADSVEWCPIDQHQHILACGTYELDKTHTKTTRLGSILLFEFRQTLKLLHKTQTSAVLDMKWSPQAIYGKVLLAVALSSNEIKIFELKNQKIDEIFSKNLTECVDKDCLALSLDWFKNCDGRICVSDSHGCICILKISETNIEMLERWTAHELESWIVCFDATQNQILYSGGDDCKLKIWDTRSSLTSSCATVKTHESGVTALQCRLGNDFNLTSGSYDEKICVWDTRNWKKPNQVITMNGGIWRLKWNQDYLLSACIYGGFSIININNVDEIMNYCEHGSIAYGADWYCGDKNDFDSFTIATCSFYDHKLDISTYNTE